MQRVNTSKQELDFDLYWRISMSVTWDPLPSRRSCSSRFVCRCCPHLTALFQTDCNLLTQDAKFLCCVQCTVPETWVLPLSLGRAGGFVLNLVSETSSAMLGAKKVLWPDTVKLFRNPKRAMQRAVVHCEKQRAVQGAVQRAVKKPFKG